MPTREEEEFSRRGTDRDANHSTHSTREPIDHPEMLEISADAPGADNEAPKESIDEVLKRLIIHADKPIENLPTMTAPELKLIGRCVSLSTKQTINGVATQYYYTGLVSAVTATAVTLMYVNRYTADDFKVYQEREKTALKAVAASAQEMTRREEGQAGHRHHPRRTHGRSPSSEIDQDQQHCGVPTHGYSGEGEVGVGHDGALTGQRDGAALMLTSAAGSLAAAVPMRFETEGEEKAFAAVQDGEVEESGTNEESCGGGVRRVSRPPNFRYCTTSIGPLPYVSFLRKSIHDVAFGRDPRSSFYSLFQDPSKELMDMQYLRMFVRRYLVHTSEGNNPRQVPMYAFVTVRGACPDLDRALADQLVREELPTLMQSDRAIEKDKKRNRNRQVRRELAIQEYHAPPGLFRRTGILFLTRIPQTTFLSGTVMVFMSAVFAIFLGAIIGAVADVLMVAYMSQLMSYFIASVVIWIMAGAATVLHAFNMHLPLMDDKQLVIVRGLLTVGSIVCSILMLVMLLGRLSTKHLTNLMVERSSDLLCPFYDRYQCSGLVWSCTDYYADLRLCSPCPKSSSYTNGCYYSIWGQLQIIVIPLLVFCVFNFLAVIHSIFQFVKLFLMARALGDIQRPPAPQ